MFSRFIQLKASLAKAQDRVIASFKEKTSSYAAEYPCSSSTLMLSRVFKQRNKIKSVQELNCRFSQQLSQVKEFESSIPVMVPTNSIMAENRGVVDPSLFFVMPPGINRFKFVLTSISIPQLESIWIDFVNSLTTYRSVYSDFNMMYTVQSIQSHALLKQMPELNSNLFQLIAMTQLQIGVLIQTEFDRRRDAVIAKVREPEDVRYLVNLVA
jgi:hypothetical protein